jgi:hypothetical protein
LLDVLVEAELGQVGQASEAEIADAGQGREGDGREHCQVVQCELAADGLKHWGGEGGDISGSVDDEIACKFGDAIECDDTGGLRSNLDIASKGGAALELGGVALVLDCNTVGRLASRIVGIGEAGKSHDGRSQNVLQLHL